MSPDHFDFSVEAKRIVEIEGHEFDSLIRVPNVQIN